VSDQQIAFDFAPVVAPLKSALREDVEIAQPRYAAYCAANGRTPAEQLAHDEAEYPGGKMAGFLVWSSQNPPAA
jgi:hypothetical protein